MSDTVFPCPPRQEEYVVDYDWSASTNRREMVTFRSHVLICQSHELFHVPGSFGLLLSSERAPQARKGVTSLPLMAVLVGVVTALLIAGPVLATENEWRDCSISTEDKWVTTTKHSLALRMQKEYDRRYTCELPIGACGSALEFHALLQQFFY